MKNLLSVKVHVTAFSVLFLINIIIHLDEIKEIASTFSIREHLSFFIFLTLFSSITLFLKKRIEHRFPETKKGLGYVSIIFFSTMLITYYLYYNYRAEYQSVVTLLISSVLIGSGWWVQATVSKVAARKSHTLNILMTQRNSELFHKRSQNALSVFGFNCTINECIAKAQVSPTDKDICNKKLKKKYKKAIKDFVYLLNYYEFICSGINNGDFDEFLMKDCLSDIIPRLEMRGFHVIKLSRHHFGKSTFENIIKVINSWSESGSLILKVENGEQIPTFNYFYDTNKEEDLFVKEPNDKQ